MINRKELIKKFIDFYKSKDHKEILNASLIPENDPTVLFTTAGMHPLVPYLLGQSHPSGKRLVNVQRCIRTGDIDEVGDSYHHTFFEMLGKWSLGDYFKEDAIKYTFEFFTKILKIPIERLAVSCFAGNEKLSIPRDDESARVWKSLGFNEDRIAFLKDNWWETPGPGPCGPDTEIFYWKLNEKPAPEKFDPEDENWIELGNDVLMQYEKNKKAEYKPAKQKNIDFGGGVERIVTVLNCLEDDYLSNSFKPIIEEIEKISGKKYQEHKKEMRIIADHVKASVFIINDGIVPGNTEQGYVLRRLIRKAVRNLKNLNVPILEIDATAEIAKKVMFIYSDYKFNKEKVLEELKKEETKFQKTLDKGLREFEKMSKDKKIQAKEAFLLYQSYGFPIELIKDLAKEKNIEVDEKGFEKELKKHQELSRTASAGKFKAGLADNSEATTKLHTATHLLLAGLKKILKKPNIEQRGSNINPERLRFDFTFDRKLEKQELKEIEDFVNDAIKKLINVKREEMTPEQAKKQGATGIFDKKYGDKVSVYTIGDISKEICSGPHVKNTSELGKFKIKKESSSSAGVRRIKAVLE